MWGEVEAEPEVDDWLRMLSGDQFGHAAFYIDLLAAQGPSLSEPYTRQLRGKLRELRFHLTGEQYRIAYYIANGRRIVLLTVFHKAQRRAPTEVERAWRAMLTCIAAGHTVEDDDDSP